MQENTTRYYIPLDIESGTTREVSKERYDRFMKALVKAMPVIEAVESTVFGGVSDKLFIKSLCYAKENASQEISFKEDSFSKKDSYEERILRAS